MVVWLKPCKSRSSPGVSPSKPSANAGGFVFVAVAPKALPATGHRQGLYPSKPPASCWGFCFLRDWKVRNPAAIKQASGGLPRERGQACRGRQTPSCGGRIFKIASISKSVKDARARVRPKPRARLKKAVSRLSVAPAGCYTFGARQGRFSAAFAGRRCRACSIP